MDIKKLLPPLVHLILSIIGLVFCIAACLTPIFCNEVSNILGKFRNDFGLWDTCNYLNDKKTACADVDETTLTCDTARTHIHASRAFIIIGCIMFFINLVFALLFVISNFVSALQAVAKCVILIALAVVTFLMTFVAAVLMTTFYTHKFCNATASPDEFATTTIGAGPILAWIGWLMALIMIGTGLWCKVTEGDGSSSSSSSSTTTTTTTDKDGNTTTETKETKSESKSDSKNDEDSSKKQQEDDAKKQQEEDAKKRDEDEKRRREEAERQEAERKEAERKEAERREQERQEAERREQERRDAEAAKAAEPQAPAEDDDEL